MILSKLEYFQSMLLSIYGDFHRDIIYISVFRTKIIFIFISKANAL